jgi:hypothetical protein
MWGIMDASTEIAMTKKDWRYFIGAFNGFALRFYPWLTRACTTARHRHSDSGRGYNSARLFNDTATSG